MTTASLPSDDLITQLWRHARLWLAEMLADFISPAAIAKAIGRKALTAFRLRLQMLDSLVMKLLLIEACHPFPDRRAAPIPGPRRAEAVSAAQAGPINTNRAEAASEAAPQTSEFMGRGLGASRRPGEEWVEHPDHPITWRVRFRMRIPRQRQRQCRSATAPAHRSHPAPESIRAAAHAHRLARRFEALRRVIADPRAAIAALARKLAALGPAAHGAALRIALWRPRAPHLCLPHGHAMVAAHDVSRLWRDSS